MTLSLFNGIFMSWKSCLWIGSSLASSFLIFHRKYKQLFFYSGGVNFLMQLQFLAPVELFLKQLKGYSFWHLAESIFFYLCSFFFFPAFPVKSVKGSRRANYLILTQGGDKKEQYTRIRTMTDCICTLSCGAAIGTFTFEELQVFQTSACGESTR